MIEILKVLICIPFLIYASYSDIKTRRVSNRVWPLMLGAGSIFIIHDLVRYGLEHLIHLVLSFAFIFIFVYILFYLNAFGGADAKVLMVISLIIPAYPVIELAGATLPLYGVPLINLFAFGVFTNSIILTVVVPLGLFIYNLIKLPANEIIKNPFYLFIGYMHPVSDLGERHLKLIETYQENNNGEVSSKFSRSGVDIDDRQLRTLRSYAKKGLIGNKVWVTPGLPFMIPITAGFIAAVIFGDLIFYLTLNYLV